MGGGSPQRETSKEQAGRRGEGGPRLWLEEASRPGRQASAGRTLTLSPCPHGRPGEPYVTIRAYTAEMEDEVSLQEGEAIEVIHKLLDGWWVIR